jgi:hypothetical protein
MGFMSISLCKASFMESPLVLVILAIAEAGPGGLLGRSFGQGPEGM